MDAYIKISKDKFESFIDKTSRYKNSLVNKKFKLLKELKYMPWYKKYFLSSDWAILNNEVDNIDYEIEVAYDIINLFSQEVDYVYLDFYTYNLLTNEIWKVDAFDI